MRLRRKHYILRLSIAATAVTLLTAGCANTNGNGNDGVVAVSDLGDLEDGIVNADPATGEPEDGGTLTFAAYAEPASLDPAKTIASATTGGIEMVNIYDSIMRYDAETGTIVPQLAEDLTSDPDFRTWTLTIPDNVTFSDGTLMDASAVKYSQQRYSESEGPESGLWNANVASIETPTQHTIIYTLNKPWPNFPSILTSGPGMIVAKSAGPVDGDFTPIGAGPFSLAKWQQGTSMTLSAREDYWGGPPSLDAIEIAYMPTTQVSMDTFNNDEVDMTLAREPDDVAFMLEHGIAGFASTTNATNITMINASPGRPGADQRVRKAMQLAIDPGLISKRTYGMEAIGSNQLFAEASKWNTSTDGPSYDPEQAKRLVAEAKADGFDGHIVSVFGPSQAKQKQALSTEAMLEAVGFNVETKILPTFSDQIRLVAAERNYDLSDWGLSIRDPNPLSKMAAAMTSEGSQTYGMYTSKKMDSLIEKFQTTSGDKTKRELMSNIQMQVNRDVPFLVNGSFPEYVGWQQNVHGIKGTSNSMVLLGEAWKA
ncbi:ABC transporter substrate-binding protein [Tomitella cavernea]|uniref:ABC transporter substrate-binding protein n=1 Tax=Tomitella cavernea TaxID=1387982 RepID=A0ABP9CS99_9ACTN|nr:ABC transporter substrate-binding protein [Tomitella cavernea]